MTATITKLLPLASPDSGAVTLWHYVTTENPLADGHFNDVYQYLHENDVILTIIRMEGRAVVTAFLTVLESKKDGVKVQPQTLGIYKQLSDKGTDA